MKITDVKRHILDKHFSDYYIFTGPEIEVQRVYVNKIAEVSGLTLKRINNVADVWEEITSPSLFDENCCYVVRDDKDLLSNDKLKSAISNGALGKNILIHLVTSVDRRTKFAKEYSDNIVVFERLSTDNLVKTLSSATKLSKRNLERLVTICDNDYSRCLLELDKLNNYATDNIDSAFEHLVDVGVIYTPPRDAVFLLVDAIIKGQKKLIYELLDECEQIGEANMVILANLYNTARQVLQVKTGNKQDIAKSTGLTAWQIKCASDKVNYISADKLCDIIYTVQRVQKGIVTGLIPDELSIKYLLTEIL